MIVFYIVLMDKKCSSNFSPQSHYVANFSSIYKHLVFFCTGLSCLIYPFVSLYLFDEIADEYYGRFLYHTHLSVHLAIHDKE